ncbi:peptidoglycan-binding protein [Roseibium sp. MMSF_3544]|uniref:peptidoglycan-binding protein n=1 Tax=unclassified Roseibium TaxID=2629323 RepID=UPI00273FA41C|nr:peptidoglycan-binding protein [Roseibium sp. MMSF_3544]
MLRYFLVFLLVAIPALAQTGEQVRTVQQELANKGYDVGTVDGQFGPKTAAAIALYQSDWQLPQTGEISDELISRLWLEHPDTVANPQKAENQDCLIFLPEREAQQKIIFEGDCTTGKREGQGKTTISYVKFGETFEYSYEGNYLNDRLHGQGKFVASDFVFEGNFQNDVFEGKGALIWNDGTRYDGDFQEGMMHGRGAYSMANGTRYEGEFHTGKWNGQGILTLANGGRFVGEFREGSLQGTGEFFSATGNHYKGEFKDNLLDGRGKLTYPTGAFYEGEFQANKPHGSGSYTSADGEVFSGSWKSGCWSNGTRYVVLFTTAKACGYE